MSSRVRVGEPFRKSALHWVVPYNVIDDAGNEATTVWRDVVVEEVDFEAMEAKIREEVRQSKETEIQNAVTKALQEERKKQGYNKKGRNTAMKQECPACPTCGEDAGNIRFDDDQGKLDMAACEKICEQRAMQCSLREESYAMALLVWMEQFVPSTFALFIIGCSVAVFSLAALSFTMRVLFNPGSFAGNYDYVSEQERELSLQSAVTYYPGGSPQPQRTPQMQSPHFGGGSLNNTPAGTPGGPPKASMSMGHTHGGFFMSPQPSPGAGLFTSPPMQTNGNMNDIYASPGLIQPSPRQGDSGLRRRSPGGY